MKRKNLRKRAKNVEAMVGEYIPPRGVALVKSRHAEKHHARKSSKIRLRDETLREGAIRVKEYVSPAIKKERRF